MAGGRGGCKEGWRKQQLRPLLAPSTEAAVRHRTAMAGTTARPSYMLIHGFCQVDALPRWKFALCQAFEPEDERCQELMLNGRSMHETSVSARTFPLLPVESYHGRPALDVTSRVKLTVQLHGQEQQK